MNKTPKTGHPAMSEIKIIFIGALLVAVGPISMSLYTPALPELIEAFDTTEALVKMTLTVYFAGFALTQLVCGPLSDGLGRRPVTIIFIAVYLLASIIALFAPTIEIMLAARFLQGIGAAVGTAISRAIVRDVYTDSRSVRIMNLMGLFIAITPALAPAIGGLTLEIANWRALFLMMVLMGLGTLGVTIVSMRETIARDLSRIRPLALIGSYRVLMKTPYFVLASLVVGGSVGAIYALTTITPFILMDILGLSPTAFGFSMILQAGMFIVGAAAVQALLPRIGAKRLVPIGLIFIAGSCFVFVLCPFMPGPTFFMIMAPVAFYSFGIAFILPAMLSASLVPFPHIAGAASALTGFLQMGAGLLASAAATLFNDPVIALAIIMPTMTAIALISWLIWRSLPTPAIRDHHKA